MPGMGDGTTRGGSEAGDPVGRTRVCLVTHPPEGAEAFATRLVRERLAACVNVLPVTSVYRWEGEVQVDGERLLVIKTTVDRLELLERELASHHPYDLPELVALRPAEVEGRYAAWIHAEIEPGAPSA